MPRPSSFIFHSLSAVFRRPLSSVFHLRPSSEST
jgi:hypothetical protein